MSPNDAITFHDTIAIEFANRYESSAGFRERFRVWTDLFERYVTPADRVLDLGCGSGIFSHYLAEKGCRVTGIDGSDAMIALCRQKKTMTPAQFITSVLPLGERTWFPLQDVVLMSSLLEYLNDPTGMLKQAGLLLKQNGLLIVSVPNRRSLYRQLERGLFRTLGRPAYVGYSRHATTANTFNGQLTALGFTPVETVYFSGHDPVSRVLKPLLATHFVNNLFVSVFQKTTPPLIQ